MKFSKAMVLVLLSAFISAPSFAAESLAQQNGKALSSQQQVKVKKGKKSVSKKSKKSVKKAVKKSS